ncbi:hypothetical protein B9Z65_4129 [Elsinoe australis]|uniref:PA14 domain-containing protein n=1 Tax=Elsinoe australis TaxID=40998 RepID=A0A2P7Z1X4_9PEZI|nr:hypothetical protein B9Z65_4129 [Elsinoe australis]
MTESMARSTTTSATSITTTSATSITTATTSKSTQPASKTSTSAPRSTQSPTTTTAMFFDISDYTYYEAEIETDTGLALSLIVPNTTSIYTPVASPTMTCVIDSSSAKKPNMIMAGNDGVLIPKNGGIGPVTSLDFPNTSEQANIDFANNLPTFTFEQPQGAQDGYFDLVTTVNDKKLYVAVYTDNGAVFTSAISSGGQKLVEQGTSRPWISTIFKFTCAGTMAITVDGTTYVWSITSAGGTQMKPGTPDKTTDVFIAPKLDLNQLQKRDQYTDGQAPRVPRNPGGLTSRTRSGARGMSSNGCGSGPTRDLIPQFNFGTCCDHHDFCYDNCKGGQVESCDNQYCAPGTFEGCNDSFYSCLKDTACTAFGWFFVPGQRLTCEGLAWLYYKVVQSDSAVKAFQDATAERCEPVCPNGWPLCNGQCLDMSGDRDNCGGCGAYCPASIANGILKGLTCSGGTCGCHADTSNDANNCGRCGFSCGDGQKCSGGKCVCKGDTCTVYRRRFGTNVAVKACVDFQTHPQNCGGCGNVCSSGYCVQGRCYTPKPSQVTRTSTTTTSKTTTTTSTTTTTQCTSPPVVTITSTVTTSIKPDDVIVKSVNGSIVLTSTYTTTATTTMSTTLTDLKTQYLETDTRTDTQTSTASCVPTSTTVAKNLLRKRDITCGGPTPTITATTTQRTTLPAKTYTINPDVIPVTIYETETAFLTETYTALTSSTTTLPATTTTVSATATQFARNGLAYRKFSHSFSGNRIFGGARWTADFFTTATPDYNGTVPTIQFATNKGGTYQAPDRLDLPVEDWSHAALMMQAYFIPDATGTWTFYSLHDNWMQLWLGDTAVKGWGEGNALYKAVVNAFSSVPGSYSVELVKDVPVPMAVLWGNGGSGGDSGIKFTNPAGEVTEDSTPYMAQGCPGTFF